MKADYKEFPDWFQRKAKSGESAYIQTLDEKIEGFLYLKIESGSITDIEPIINVSKSLKIGTLKINPHGTRLGERFVKKSLDFALSNGAEIVYVTIFEKHKMLMDIFNTYGFTVFGSKETPNGVEHVLVKELDRKFLDIYNSYPLVNLDNSRKYLLSIYPGFHTRLFPDSILNNESVFDVVKDISHTNSIRKVYICRMQQVSSLQCGDVLVIYRTMDGKGSAEYCSVATSICVVEDIKEMCTFSTYESFKATCKNYSVFSENELQEMYTSKKPHFIIKMTYNIALKKRIIRKSLIEDAGLSRDAYWGFFEITKSQLQKIIELGEVNESYIVD